MGGQVTNQGGGTIWVRPEESSNKSEARNKESASIKQKINGIWSGIKSLFSENKNKVDNNTKMNVKVQVELQKGTGWKHEGVVEKDNNLEFEGADLTMIPMDIFIKVLDIQTERASSTKTPTPPAPPPPKDQPSSPVHTPPTPPPTKTTTEEEALAEGARLMRKMTPQRSPPPPRQLNPVSTAAPKVETPKFKFVEELNGILAQIKDPKQVEALLKNNEHLLDKRDSSGITPFLAAVANKNEAAIAYIFSNNFVDPKHMAPESPVRSHFSDISKNTAFHLAVQTGDPGFVARLRHKFPFQDYHVSEFMHQPNTDRKSAYDLAKEKMEKTTDPKQKENFRQMLSYLR